jgi:glycosyltransferase involved in cell wall biosynthesis
MTMKVLLFNTMEAGIKVGGGITQFTETAQELRALGVTSHMPQVVPKDLTQYDLVHLFSLQTIANGVELINAAKHQGVPVVLSTIFWDLDKAIYARDCLRFSSSSLVRFISKFNYPLAKKAQALRYIRGRLHTLSLQRYALRSSDLILPNSIAELEILALKFDMPDLRARAVFVPNGVTEQPLLAPPPQVIQSLPEKYILQAASYHPVKGQSSLIQAMMDEKNIPIVCMGPCNEAQNLYFNYCQNLANKRGNTFLIRGAEYTKMPWFYSRAKVHVLPSMRESPGLASLEAAIYGANCVVSIHAPIAEYFGFDAFVCDPEKPSDLKTSILNAWASPPTKLFRQRILREYTWKKAAEATFTGYQHVLKNRSHR